MSEYLTLQVADTRFAVRCSYPSFMSWLAERHSGFLSQEEPHLWLNLSLDSILQVGSAGQALSITATGNHEHHQLSLSVAYPHPADFFWPMLQICLRCAIAAKLPPDLLLHSSGIVHDGMAYLFSGKSGVGKSTVCKLLAQDSSFIILHDDMVAIAQTQEVFHAWSTPLSGEMPASYSMGAPLQAVFFLKHDQTNYTTRLSHRKAAGLLALSLVPPFIARYGHLVVDPPESVRRLLLFAESIPCYELHFRPERSFWDCIPKLFEAESVTTIGKGQSL